MAQKTILVAKETTLNEVKTIVNTILNDRLNTIQANLTGAESSSIKSLCANIINTVDRIYANTDGLENSNDELDREIDELTALLNQVKKLLNDSNIATFNSKLATLDTVVNAIYLKTNSDSDSINNIKNTTDKINAARIEKIDSIGNPDDMGGSPTAGTLMAKHNRVIAQLTALLSMWTNTRAGYIDNIYEATSQLAGSDLMMLPSLKHVYRGRLLGVQNRKLIKETGVYVTNAQATAYYIDIQIPELVNVNKSLIRVKSFMKDGTTVRDLPAEFIEITDNGKSEKIRIYSVIGTTSAVNITDEYSYFWEVQEFC